MDCSSFSSSSVKDKLRPDALGLAMVRDEVAAHVFVFIGLSV